MKRLLLLAAVAAAAGCNPFASLTQIPSQYCPSNAVGLYMSLFEGAKNTDDIDVLVALENEPAKHISYTRTPGAADHETLEIDLDVGKHFGSHVTIAAVARLHGVKVASDVEVKYLDGSSCLNVQMLLDPTISTGSGCIFDKDCPQAATGSDEVCNVGACCTPYLTSDMLSCPVGNF